MGLPFRFLVTDVEVENLSNGLDKGITGYLGPKKEGHFLNFKAPLTIALQGIIALSQRRSLSLKQRAFARMSTCGGYREYWTGVEGCDSGTGPIEIHFIDEVNPGYFWIFPVNENVVNVGVGMVISEQRKQQGMRSSLKKMQKWITSESDRFSHRFKGAQMVKGSGRGWQLPFGSPRKSPPSFQPRRGAMAGAMALRFGQPGILSRARVLATLFYQPNLQLSSSIQKSIRRVSVDRHSVHGGIVGELGTSLATHISRGW